MRRDARRRHARSGRGRIVGGKAIARRLNFSQLRELNESTDRQKQPTVAPTRELVCPRSTKKKHRDTTSIPSLTEAYAYNDTLPTPSLETTKTRWRPLGPFCIPHGQTYGSGPGCRPSISGRVSTIAIDPSDPDHILIGSGGGGGVWATRDNGKSWTPTSDDQPSLSIGAIAFDPNNSLIVYAGTGEGDSTLVKEKNMLGVGLLRSVNGGDNWTLICREPFDQTAFYDLAIDPLNDKHILAATTAGLYESSDAGLTFTARRSQRTWSLSIHPVHTTDSNSTQEVFAGCLDGVFRSINGGTSWSRVSLPGGRRRYERIEVCHAASDGNVVYVFATTPDPEDENNDPIPHLWRRNVLGGAFEAVEKLPKDLVTEQSWYDWFAAVAPNNPDVLYIGAINAHKGIRSPSGIWEWENISARKYTTSIHPDMHVIAFSPGNPNVIYIGCDGGIFRSTDGGKDWVSLNKGLCLTEVEFLAQHPEFESWLIAGTQDNGTLHYQGNEVWYHISDGDGGDCGVSSTFPYTCYVTFYGMGIARSKKGGGWNTWPRPPRELIGPHVNSENDYPDGALFYAPLEVNGRTVAQAGNKVCISTNGGDEWTKETLEFRPNELSSALCIPTPTRVFVGTTRGRLFRLDLVGKTWHSTKLTRPVIGNVSDILVDPAHEDSIFITFSSTKTKSHVFRSDDGGLNWNDISTGLPNIAVNAIEIDPQNTKTIFIGADVGLYRSDDAGETWALFNSGLPNVLVKDLALHQPSRLLRAGTQARGVWEIPIDDAPPPDVEIYLRDSPVDTGRISPSPFAVMDPFSFRAQAFWWQCVDIKVDSSSLRTTLLDDLDFEIFGDDQSMIGISDDDLGIQFATGLLPENPIRNQNVRVYVRVNNRGVEPATNVSVSVYFASTTTTSLPKLPSKFWENFQNNKIEPPVLGALSSSPANFHSVTPVGRLAGEDACAPSTTPAPWQKIDNTKLIPVVAAGSSKIIGFDWSVPATAADTIALLSLVSADNDPLVTDELHVPSLITGNKKCGLRNVTVVNPSPANGPVLRALQLNFGGNGDEGMFSLVSTQTTPHVIRAVILSKRLSKLARQQKHKTTKLSSVERIELAKLFGSNPVLEKELDTQFVLVPPQGELFKNMHLSRQQTEPMIFFFSPNVQSGIGSIMQVGKDKTVVGGHTFLIVG